MTTTVKDTARARAYRVLDAVQPVPDERSRAAFIAQLAAATAPAVISFVNAHGFNLAWKDGAIADDFCRADHLLRDGAGMSILMKALDRPPGVNMNGTDLTPLIVQAFNGRKIAVCGTAEPYLSKAVAAIEGLGGTVVLAMDGFAPPEDYAPRLLEAAPELVILGMGMPKQERVATDLRDRARLQAVIVNGGAILDFWAGRFPRAPLAWQRARMEWLFRLIQEPRRLWRRYLLGNVVFLCHVVILRLVMRRA